MTAAAVATALPWRDRWLVAWMRRARRGSARLAHFLGRQHSVLARTTHGTLFALQPFSYIDRTVIRSGYYESEVLAALRPHLGPGAVLWDIGAHFGLHGITAKFLSSETTVVGFEPAPGSHRRLVQNTRLNRVDLVLSSLALSDFPGVAPLHLALEGNSGMTTLSPWSGAAYTGTVPVATARGDDLIARGALPSPTVVKIDVEGHELAALTGLANTLASASCRTVVFEDSLDENSPVKLLLRTAGFAIAALTRREDTAHALGNFVAQK